VLAVYGSRGGVGTTFVATHLAAAYARRGRRCALVDLDVVFADVTAAVGVGHDEEVRTVADLGVLADEVAPRHIEEIAWRHPVGFDVLLAPGQGRVRTSGEDYRRAIAASRRMCEVVLLHVPRALDEVGRAGLDVADRVLIVLGLDVLSFRDAKRAIEAAELEGRCAFVVNRAARSEIAPSDVRRVFGQAPLAVIPSDRGVRAAQDRGRLLPGRGRVGRAFDRLARAAIEVPA
jgi:pilus assembly protein CpaE